MMAHAWDLRKMAMEVGNGACERTMLQAAENGGKRVDAEGVHGRGADCTGGRWEGEPDWGVKVVRGRGKANG